MSIFDDPLSFVMQQRQQQDQDEQNAAFQAAQRKATLQPMAPEEEQSALGRLMGGAVSGLGFAGASLDKAFGGRAIRGALGGNPRELLSAIPFSDTLGLTDESQRVSGEDLAKQWGLLQGEGEKGTFELRDLVGPTLEAALDPGTYLTFGAGALTKSGQAAQKLGVLPGLAGRMRGFQSADEVLQAMNRLRPAGSVLAMPEAETLAKAAGTSLGDLAGQKLGGLAGLRVPFAGGETAVLGTGPQAQRVADWLGQAGDKALYAKPTRYLSALFDSRLEGDTSEAVQRAARANYAAAQTQNALTRSAAAHVAEPLMASPELGLGQLRDVVERGGGRRFIGPYAPELYESANRYADWAAKGLDTAQRAGVKINPLASVFGLDYAARNPTPLENALGAGGPRDQVGRRFSTRPGSATQRQPFLDLPGGTKQVEEMVANPAIAGRDRQPLDILGRPLQDLSVGTPRAEQGMAAIQQAVAQILNAGGDARVIKQSRKSIYNALRNDVLEQSPGTLTAKSAYKTGEYGRLLKQFTANPAALAPQELERLKYLNEVSQQAKYLTRRAYAYTQDAALQGLKDPAAEIVPFLQKAYQDRTASRMVGEQLGFNELVPAGNKRVAYTNPELAGLRDRAAALAQTGGQLPPQQLERLARLEHLEKNYPKLSRYLGGLDPTRAGPDGAGLFANDTVMDRLFSQAGLDRKVANATVAQDAIARSAQLGFPQNPSVDYVPVRKLVRDLGLTGEATQNILAKVNESQQLGLKPMDANKLYVGKDVAADLLGRAQRLTAPEAVAGPLGIFDTLTKVFRAGNTAPFPGFHARNLFSSSYQNLAQGAGGALGFGYQAMEALRRGEVVPGLAEAVPLFKQAGLTDEAATRQLGRMMFENQAAGRGIGPLRETAERMGSLTEGVGRLMPGVVPEQAIGQTLKDYGRAFVPDSLQDLKFWRPESKFNPLAIEGIGGRTATTNAPVAAGRQLGELVDDVTRGGSYIDFLKQGYTPQAAADATRATHFDYGALTDFERKVMRRVMPFYSWTRNVIPQTALQLAREPGGLTGQSVRFSDAMRQQDGFLPDYLGGGLAVPLGGRGEDGTQRYLTRLDLPYESPLEMLQFGPGGLAKTGMKLLGNLNPLIKGPLEVATNRQFYSGRDMTDLYSYTGMPLLDQAAMNSPLARLYGIGGQVAQLAEGRKDPLAFLANTLTGAKLSDIDMNTASQKAVRAALEDAMRNNPSFHQSVDFAPAKGSQLSPGEIDLMRLYNQQAREQRAAAKTKAP